MAALPLEPELQAFIDHLAFERRLASRSLALYSSALQRLQLSANVARVALRSAQVHDVRGWTAQLRNQGLAPRSIALVLSAWRGLYGWWARQGVISINPVEGVRAPKSAKPLPKALSVDQAVALASYQTLDLQVPERAALNARDHAITEMLYGCGLRISELLALDLVASRSAAGWVDISDTTVHVLGKGSKRRSVPVGGAALVALQAWLAQRMLFVQASKADEPALFISRRGSRLTPNQLRTRLKQQAVQAGLPTHVHPHMLRHSFASHILQSSGDLRAVQELLGHSAISTTQIYTQLDFQHLAKVYDTAHPRAKRKAP